jgi:hypothetical protein
VSRPASQPKRRFGSSPGWVRFASTRSILPAHSGQRGFSCAFQAPAPRW